MSHARSEYRDFQAQAPEAYSAVLALGQIAAQAGLDKQLLELIKLRASQINGCAVCLQHHILLSESLGMPVDKLNLVAVWREAPQFSPRERAALAWTEVLTKLPEHGVPDDIYERVRTQLSEKELSDLTFVVMSINGWNRINLGFSVVPGSFDKAYGLDKAELN